MTAKLTTHDFYKKIQKTSSCWLWLGKPDFQGYGRFGQTKAHRFSYELYNGVIPKELVVRHKCDNPACVNPAHLELGTRADNNRDRHNRKRSSMDKLSIEQAYDIKYNLRHTEAMKKYPFVSETTITRIRMDRIWKHI